MDIAFLEADLVGLCATNEDLQSSNMQYMTACSLAGWYTQGGFALSSVSPWLSDPPPNQLSGV